MWKKEQKEKNTVGKMKLVDLIEIGLPRIFNLLKKKKKQNKTVSAKIKQHLIRWGQPVFKGLLW